MNERRSNRNDTVYIYDLYLIILNIETDFTLKTAQSSLAS